MSDWFDGFMFMKMMEEESERVQKTEWLETLQEELSALEDKLFDVECDEPDDILSDAYTRWESRKSLIEEQIAEIESKIWDLEK